MRDSAMKAQREVVRGWEETTKKEERQEERGLHTGKGQWHRYMKR